MAPFVEGRPEIHCDNPVVSLDDYEFHDEWWEDGAISSGRSKVSEVAL